MIAALSGLVAGIAGGMGIGGGAILIPALSFFLGTSQHEAQGINLIFFIPTSVAALIVHIKNKTIDYKKAGAVIASGIVGALLGSFGASLLSGTVLRKLFAGLLFVFGTVELFKKQEE